jgi:hypothetical protein
LIPEKSSHRLTLQSFFLFSASLQKWTSLTPDCKTTLRRISHRRRKSAMTPTVKAPWMSKIHHLSIRASWTVHWLILHLRIAAKSLGAISTIFCPSSHWSVQKRIVLLSPNSICMATEKRARVLSGTKIRSGSVLCSHKHLSRSAQPRSFKFEIPGPSNSIGLHTHPKQLDNGLPSPLCGPTKRNLHEVCLLLFEPRRREIHHHCQVNQHTH